MALLQELARAVTPTYAAFGLLVIISNAVLFQCVYSRYFHPLAKFPGPFWASITNLHHAYIYYGGQEHLSNYAMHKKYGPIVRIAPNLLIFNDPKLLPVLYHRRADKTEFYTPEIVFGPDAHPPTQFVHEHMKHTFARKRIAAPFTKTAVKVLEPVITSRIEEWIGKLKEFADRAEPVNFSDWSTYLTWDVITELCYGEAFGFVRTGQDVDGMAHALEETMVPSGVVLRIPWLWKAAKNLGILNHIIPTKEDKTGVGRAMARRDVLLEKRMNDPKKHNDILQYLMDAQPPMSENQLKSETLILMLAGSDTSSSTLRALLIHLLRHPDVLSKLLVTDFSNTKPMDAQEHSPYFEAVVKESMRHSHAAQTMFPRLVPAGGFTLGDGTFIPAKTEINMQSYCVHRDTGVFGADAEKFRPERWLESEEKTRAMERYSMLWGCGARTCAGRPVAELELFYATRRLFEEFEIQFMDPSKPVRIENYTVMIHHDMWLTFKRRSMKH